MLECKEDEWRDGGKLIECRLPKRSKDPFSRQAEGLHRGFGAEGLRRGFARGLRRGFGAEGLHRGFEREGILVVGVEHSCFEEGKMARHTC